MPSSLVLSFKKNISLIEHSAEQVTIQSADSSPNFPRNLLHFEQLSPGVLAAIRILSAEGASEEYLREIVIQTDGCAAVPKLNHCLQTCLNLGLICHTLLSEGLPFAVSVPLSPFENFSFRAVDLHQKYVLSRFAYCRVSKEQLVLESPLSSAQIILSDWRGSALVAELAKPQSCSELWTEIPGISQHTTQLFLSLLLSTQILCEATKDEKTQQEENETLSRFEFYNFIVCTSDKLHQQDSSAVCGLIETALQESEERFRAIFEQAAVGISLVSPCGQFLRVNQRYCDLLGYTRSEIVQKTFQEITYSADLEADLEYMRQLYAGEIQSFSLEKRYIRKDGQLQWVNLTASLLGDAVGIPKYAIGVVEDIQERKRTEEALKASEERFRCLSSCSPVGIFLANVQGQCTYANPRLQKILGLSFEEILGEGWAQAVHSDDREWVFAEWSTSAPMGQPVAQEYRFETHEGIVCWVQVQTSPIHSTQGRLIGHVGTVEDITQRKQATAALRQSEERYRAIVEAQTQLICRYLPDTTLTFVNDAYCRYFNTSYDQLIGRSFLFLIPVQEQDKIKQHIASITLENPVATMEHRVMKPDGKIGWQQWTDQAIFDQSGRLLEFQCMGQDITKRKQAEIERQLAQEALKAQHELLQTVLDTNPNMIFVKDSQSRMVLINQAFADFYGKPAEELLGKSSAELHPDLSQAEQFLAEDWEVCSTLEQKLIPEQAYHTPSGEIRWLQVMKKPILSRDSHTCQVFGVCTDITERKQAEIQIQESLHEKEILLQEIHHRVKNNLQVICSLLDLQSQNLSDQKTLEVFRESYNRVRSMALIHEKLYQSVSLAKINFADYVETLTNYLLQSYGVNTEQLTLKLNVEEVFLNIDTAIPCGLIINELVSNSLKYAFPNSTKGVIEVKLESDTAQKFTLTVKDWGVGLPEDLNFHKITTLGLQLVKVLTKQLEGSIKIYQNKGTEFRIQFFEVKL